MPDSEAIARCQSNPSESDDQHTPRYPAIPPGLTVNKCFEFDFVDGTEGACFGLDDEAPSVQCTPRELEDRSRMCAEETLTFELDLFKPLAGSAFEGVSSSAGNETSKNPSIT